MSLRSRRPGGGAVGLRRSSVKPRVAHKLLTTRIDNIASSIGVDSSLELPRRRNANLQRRRKFKAAAVSRNDRRQGSRAAASQRASLHLVSFIDDASADGYGATGAQPGFWRERPGSGSQHQKGFGGVTSRTIVKTYMQLGALYCICCVQIIHFVYFFFSFSPFFLAGERAHRPPGCATASPDLQRTRRYGGLILRRIPMRFLVDEKFLMHDLSERL